MKGCLTIIIMWALFFAIGFYCGTVASNSSKAENKGATVSYEISERERYAPFFFFSFA